MNKRRRISDDDVPKTYEEAVTGPEANEWKQAIAEEMTSHKSNNTFSVVKLEEHMNIVTTRWVFTKKKDEHGNVVRYKARLVARGYTQEYGVDYQETFAPVLKAKSLRLITALAATDEDELEQIDFKTAYLNARLKEKIYITTPQTMKLKSDQVLQLNKALYGLKQSGREWNDEVSEYIKQMGFKQCMKDTCIYVYITKTNNRIIIGLFVDDMTIVYKKKDKKEWEEQKKRLKSKYKLTDIGKMRQIVGCRVTRDDETGVTYIDQQVNVEQQIKDAQLSDCKHTTTPGDNNIQLEQGNERVDGYTYRSMVGALIYTSTWTRPDITHAVNMCSRYMTAPTTQHQQAATKILRYLHGTSDMGIKYDNNNNKNKVMITGYCDADWAGDKKDRKSTTGYCVYVNNNLIAWNTHKQATVALSTAEAELMAITELTKEIMWLKQMVSEMGFDEVLPAVEHSDNQAAVNITNNDVDHNRTKHIEIRHMYVRSEIKTGKIKIQWVRTEQQTADIFTKALQGPIFTTHRDNLVKRLPAQQY